MAETLYQVRFLTMYRQYNPGERASWSLDKCTALVNAKPRPIAVIEGYWEDNILQPGIKGSERPEPTDEQPERSGAIEGQQDRSMGDRSGTRRKGSAPE